MKFDVVFLNDVDCYIKITDFFSKEELSDIWNEINVLSKKSKMAGLNDRSATEDTSLVSYDENTTINRKVKKSKKFSVWLDVVYSDPGFSNYLSMFDKYKYDDQFHNTIQKASYSNKVFNYLKTKEFFELQSSYDDCFKKYKLPVGTLLNYYENGDYYKSHMDLSVLTQIFWTFQEPKNFEGGDLVLSEFNHTIPIQNNCAVIIPSFYFHEVTPLKMKSESSSEENLSMDGRYSFTTFISFR